MFTHYNFLQTKGSIQNKVLSLPKRDNLTAYIIKFFLE